jgi:carboxymethylenebutenolidase
VVESETRITTPRGELPVFTVRPDGDGPFPVALLYMDGVGFREQIRENARRFAADGYLCVAPDLYYESGEGLTFDIGHVIATGWETPDGQRLQQAMGRVTPEAVVEDTKAILEEVRRDPAARDGAWVCVGYCMGARLVLHVAAAFGDEVAAVAGIHPGALVSDDPDSPHLQIPGVRGEVYFAFAEHDRTATAEVVERFREELEAHGVPGVVERMPGASHGFAMADLAAYDRDASERHFEKTLDLWRRGLARDLVEA